MARFRNNLDHVRVAAPCRADWDQMLGGDRVRFCGQCSLNVYNLSAMTRLDAETLIARTEGRLCVRFYRRGDGSIITKDCPVGLRAIRRKVSYVAKAITSAVLTFIAGAGVHNAVKSLSHVQMGGTLGVMERPVELQGQLVNPKDVPKLEVGRGMLVRPAHKTRVAGLGKRSR